MLDIKEEIQVLLLRSKVSSMRRLISLMQEKGYNIPQSGTMSTQLTKKRVRFETVQEILDFLGYELVIREKK